MLHEVVHILTHALLDTLKLLPFLFLAYLLIEFIEHRASHKLTAMLSRFGRFSPAAGAVAGIVPQCGFLVTATKLYSGRLISFGTLVAVVVATSDEAIPILLSHPDSYGAIWKLIVVKLVLACAAGFAVDALFYKNVQPKEVSEAHDHLHEGCGHESCDHGILRPTLVHTLKSALFIFLVLLAMEALVTLIGEDVIAAFLSRSLMLQPLLAALFGFVPGCASSIILTELYATGALSFGAFVAGLTTNTGIGLAVLFRSNKNLTENLILTGITLILALVAGYVLQLF